MAWLTNWNYRKAVTISNTGSALLDYQVLITVDTANLVTNLKMRSDCGDIRFTDTDGSTLLPYWIESGCNTISTKIWVKIPSVPTGTKTIYMYYGNPGLVSDSNATTVFTIPTTIATGGTITYDTNAYAIHTFTSSGIFTSSFSGDIKVTAWAGGGGGAIGNDCSAGAGGGGSGEAIVNFPLAVSPVAYIITVGNGGASGTPWSGGTCSNGFNGEDTTITIGSTTYVTVEGGYGGLLTAIGGKGGGVTGGAGGTGWASPLSGSSGTWNGYRLGGSGGGGTTGGNMNGYSGGGGPNTTNLRYSGGGGAGYYGSGGSAGFDCSGSGTANSGAGGGGANHNGGVGCGVGGSGNVIIRYINRKYASPEPTFSISITEEMLGAPVCPIALKYEGNTVHLSAIPKDGIGPYTAIFKKNNISISSLSNVIENTEVTYDYVLTNDDILNANLGKIDFSVYIEDSCPTIHQTCEQVCTINIGCMAPVCNFTVT